MPSDYSYDLPAFTDNSWSSDQSWTQSNNYSLSDPQSSSIPSSSEYSKQDNWSEGWFTDSTSKTDQNAPSADSSTFDGVWKWLTSNQGASTAGGAAQALMQAWAASNASDAKSKESQLDRDAAMAIAMLKENRINRHNESINQPANLGLVNLRR